MNFLKNNIKKIAVISLIVVITSCISVYAEYKYLSKDVSYTKTDGNVVTVEDALNELYGKISNLDKTYLYKNGNEFEELTGGWSATSQTNILSAQKNNNTIYMESDNNEKRNALITTNKINLTNYSKIKIKGFFDEGSEERILTLNFDLSDSYYVHIHYWYYITGGYCDFSFGFQNDNAYSDFNGSRVTFFESLNIGLHSFSVTEIWLE